MLSLLCLSYIQQEEKSLPRQVWKKCADAGWLAGVVGPPWPTEYVGDRIIGGVKAEEFDFFHEFIIHDEVSRCGSGGLVWGLFIGLCIGLPPVMHFGSDYLKELVCRPCLSGEKIICLCITEPYAGSDVANLQCEAKKTADGKHYIVNGEKKCDSAETQPALALFRTDQRVWSCLIAHTMLSSHFRALCRDHQWCLGGFLYSGRPNRRSWHGRRVNAAY